MQIGNVAWDQDNPDPLSDFAGFINAAGQFFQASFDIDVLGGIIIGLRGGVHASADIPSIDFNVMPGGFVAVDGAFGESGIVGGLQITQVPEPRVSLLFLVSIAPLIWVHLRKRVRDWGGFDDAGGAKRPQAPARYRLREEKGAFILPLLDYVLPMHLHSLQERNAQVGLFFDEALYHLALGYERVTAGTGR